MEWIRRRPTAAAIVGVVSVLAVLALVFLLISPKSDPPDSSSIGDLSTVAPSPSVAPTLPELTPGLPSSTASVPSAADVKKATQKTFEQLSKGYTSGGLSSGGLSSGSFNMQGLQGGSIYQYLPKHRITARISSGSPIGTVGYVIPTSLKSSNGTVRNVGTNWSLSTTVYGDPDYAQLFMQSDSIGHPITCTITVDGKITEQRTTEGPYARLICQG
jgi:hypothetical protein